MVMKKLRCNDVLLFYIIFSNNLLKCGLSFLKCTKFSIITTLQKMKAEKKSEKDMQRYQQFNSYLVLNNRSVFILTLICIL